MKHVIAFLMLFVTVASARAASPLIDINVDTEDGIYNAGQEAVFTITPLQPLPAEGIYARYVFLRDGVTTVSQGRILVKNWPIEMKRTLFKPGWLMCRMSWTSPTTGSTSVGAIFSPDKIFPEKDEPADFDEFWAAQKAKLAGDYEARITPMPSKQPGVDLYHVKIPMPEGPAIQGYMTKPHGAAPRSLGAIAFTHGAYTPARPSNIPSRTFGMIGFDFNPHGTDDFMTRAEYRRMSSNELSRYWTRGWQSRDTCYFRLMFMRVARAIDFLTRQPEWDGKTLCVFGGSMGGGQAIAAAALDQRVSVIVAGIPALCDLSGYRAHRIDGWPHAIKTDKDFNPLDPKIAATVPYFDGANFAKRIKCDVFMATGLIDRTCQPCTVFAAYNSLKSKNKTILVLPKKAHEFSTDQAQRAVGEKFIMDSRQ